MKNRIVGISAPRRSRCNEVIRVVSDTLQLAAVDIRQPVLEMTAALLGVEASELYLPPSMSGKRIVHELGISTDELVASFSRDLQQIKSDFFIKRLQMRMDELASRYAQIAFSGYVISGISNEMEAQWVRDQGGVMVHIFDYRLENLGEFHALQEQSNDIFLITSTAVTVNKISLNPQLLAIQEHFKKADQNHGSIVS
jgi:hypothetical protein